MEFTNSPLYHRCKEKLEHLEDWDEILENLSELWLDGVISKEQKRLSMAFAWDETPQGHRYWSRLHHLGA